ncbi:RNA-binding domain-containing protein [Sistotremastrum niveocremeum HHB9708]|uniref:RNA-binding domain-containing protein n=1 Tax=Sistotremastrum niveocremeum HHB9708 TaxID=1314777 RepID=A0A164N370_9AGAM|nr:RNA-binding domain-containing protein [Sistotremastrum niveocremeum HHB9708]
MSDRKHEVLKTEMEDEKHGSTIFVSNLPFAATSTDLQTLFSDIAPVRTAFVVLDKEKKVSKGVGLVGFAIKEDAERAMDMLDKGEINILGRNLRGEWAGKHTPGEPKEKKEKKTTVPRITKDPNAVRTIVISGLNSSISSKHLWKKIRKCPGAQSIEYPIPSDPSLGTSPRIAHALFATPAEALKATQSLHAHTFKGSLLSVTLKKRADGLVKPIPSITSTSKTNGKVEPSRSSRLIIRNLPWNITEADLRALFLPHGPIHSVHLPTAKPPPTSNPPTSTSTSAPDPTTATAPDPSTPADTPSPSTPPKDPPKRSTGFAFIWFLSRKDAERAISAVNGMNVVPGLHSALKLGGRVVAVDWAISKERWEKEVAKADADAEEEKVEDDDDSEAGDSASASTSDSGSNASEDDSNDESDSHFDSSDEDEDEDMDAEDEEPKRPSLPTPEDGTTLFLRNLPYEATEDELRNLFKPFGTLRYARITIDHATSRPRGTGFICFWSPSSAQSVLSLAASLKSQSTGLSLSNLQRDSSQKKNPFAMPSILTPDPSAGLSRALVLHGRTIDVSLAVSRERAGELRDEGERGRRKEDKRCLYLLREGVIFPNTPAAATLSNVELDERVTSFNTRRALLKSNPSLYISKTRLSVRRVPVWVSERVLKRVAGWAVGEFERGVKRGEREGLSVEEIAVDEDEDETGKAKAKEGEESKGDGKKKKKWTRPTRPTAVPKSSSSTKSKPTSSLKNKGRSKGYGFLELRTHADALRVLRVLNGRKGMEGMMRGWWRDELVGSVKRGEEEVRKMGGGEEKEEKEADANGKNDGKEEKGKAMILEFSIENIQVVKRRAEKISGEREERTKPVKRRVRLPFSHHHYF